MQPDFWHWLVLGLVLAIIEALAPGTFFLWLGVSSVVVGLVVWVVPQLALEYQILFFALFSLASIALSRRYLKSHPIHSEQPLLNRRGEQYIGRTFTLTEPIVNGRGKIHVDDSTWRVTGEDCEAGSQVLVTGAEGVVLKVTRKP